MSQIEFRFGTAATFPICHPNTSIESVHLIICYNSKHNVPSAISRIESIVSQTAPVDYSLHVDGIHCVVSYDGKRS